MAVKLAEVQTLYYERLIGDAALTALVPADDIRDIRSVQITIVGRSGAQVPVLFNSGTDNTGYTNQQGTEILAAQNDEFHRIRLTSEVKVRNMGL